MTDGYIKFNDLLTAVGNMLKEMGNKEVTIKERKDFCDCDGCEYWSWNDTAKECASCCRYYFDGYIEKKGD